MDWLAKYLLPLLVLLPLLGGIAIAFLPRGRESTARSSALFWSLLTFALSVLMACRFNYSTDGSFDPSAVMQFDSSITWVPSFGLSFGFGIDSLSLWLVLLTTFLMPIVILGSATALSDAVKPRVKEYYLWLLILEAAMVGTFVATDLVFFYICFEFTLIPLYFLIGIFGSTQRLKAARVFFLYTFTGSMLTFAGVLYVAWFNTTLDPVIFQGAGAWTFDIHTLYGAARQMSDTQQMWVLLALLAGFAVKVPLFPVHTWLPLAHTEAPTAGSVILAGVLLKLGTYGLLRFAIPMTPVAAVKAAPYIATFAIIGILYTALVCWVQKDIKKLIAYSSVSHLGFCVLGMFAMNRIGIGGSVLYMINHGLSTGALFICIGILYERFHTREMAQMSGLARVMPVWAFFMVFFCFASVGLPGLNGFVGEFLTLLGAFTSQQVLGRPYAVIATLGMILAAIYILYMVGRVVWGPLKIPAAHGHEHGGHDHGHGHAHVKDLNGREIATLLPLAVACLWLGLFPTPILRTIEPVSDRLTAPVAAIVDPDRLQGGTNIKVIDADLSVMLNPQSEIPKAPKAPETPGASDAPKHSDDSEPLKAPALPEAVEGME
ncbi:MAG: NADH-quinone oxidoreductase subunit M [Phycisphaeraceae bacterium]|nr:NADH-quinone oxidoreductase subunit M [Phycisphaeraceae bacterium]